MSSREVDRRSVFFPISAGCTPLDDTTRSIKAARERVHQRYYDEDELIRPMQSKATKNGRTRCTPSTDRTTTVEELNSLMPRTKSGKHEPKKIIREGA
jgi:hypothetical protein